MPCTAGLKKNLITKKTNMKPKRIISPLKTYWNEQGFPYLTDEQLLQFKRSGFLPLDRITTDEDVISIRSTLISLFEQKSGFEEGRQFNFSGNENDPDAPNFPQIIKPHVDALSLRESLFFRNAFALAKQILGPDACFDVDHVLNKPPIDGPATPFHQDEAFRLPQFDYEEISFWMPLQEVNLVNGCMEYIDGSHQGEIYAHRSPNNDPGVHALECCEGFSPEQAIISPLPAGGCGIHSGKCIHGAGPNLSIEPRLAYVLIFHRPPTRRSKPRAFPWMEEKETERTKRERAYLTRNGLFRGLLHKFKSNNPLDYPKLVSKGFKIFFRRLRK
jgi:hypothetical protein